MSLQVVGYTLEEYLLAEMSTQHANDGTALQVTDVIEDLVNFKAIVDRYFDGMGSA